MWFDEMGKDSDVVISSRVRLARNLKDMKFPGMMSNDEAKAVISKIAATDAMRDFEYTDIPAKDNLSRALLLEEHFISADLAESKIPCGLFMSMNKQAAVMVNEEDHIRMQAIVPGYDLEKAYEIVDEIDNKLEKQIEYAFSDKYGYLTKCPTNAGTGMRASVMLHLPGLTITDNINNMNAAMNKFGIVVRGMYGEGSKASACIYQISNQFTLGVNEDDTIQKLKNAVDMLIEKERQVCRTLNENNTPVFKDKVMRAYGLLSSAYIMSSTEFMNLLPYVRMGVNMSIINNISTATLNSLLVRMQPAHIIATAHTEDTETRDVKRAELLRCALGACTAS